MRAPTCSTFSAVRALISMNVAPLLAASSLPSENPTARLWRSHHGHTPTPTHTHEQPRDGFPNAYSLHQHAMLCDS
jgi:hypothetical protein